MSMKRTAVTITLLSLILAAATQALGNQAPAPSQSCAATVALADEAKSTVAKFRIPGMSAPNCPVIIKAAVSRIKGVTRVEADLETKSAIVEFTAGSTTVAAIQAVIKERTGYEAELVQ